MLKLRTLQVTRAAMQETAAGRPGQAAPTRTRRFDTQL
jgi:hypothetical protein